MTLSESAINEILVALDTGNGADLIRQLAELGMQDLIEAEATEYVGAEKWERTIDRIAHRNGHRPRVLSTKAGDLQLGIPKFDKGSFMPSVLEPRRRIDQAMYAVVMEAYVNGVSTRSVDNLVAALGVDTGISKVRGLPHLRGANNPLERLNKEVKRRSNVVGIFPNNAAAIRLIGAVLADQHEEWAIARRYMSEGSMAELDQPRDTEDSQAQLEGPDTPSITLGTHHSVGRCPCGRRPVEAAIFSWVERDGSDSRDLLPIAPLIIGSTGDGDLMSCLHRL